MGYRNYIGSIPKREYNKIKSLNKEQLFQYYNIDEYNTKFVKELYEFGKYVDFHPPKKSIKSFFKNKELQKLYDVDEELYVVTKEFLAYIIDTYKEKIKTYYNKMLEPFRKEGKIFNVHSLNYEFSLEQKTALFEIYNHVRSMSYEWLPQIPYDLNDNTPEITSSWKYEYNIFELVRIYKTFDWKRNVLVYYGG